VWRYLPQATSGILVGCLFLGLNGGGRHSAQAKGVVMALGKVKWFNDSKGFGFVVCQQTGVDVFVHHTVIEGEGFRTLDEDETVEYESEHSPKGQKATRVRRLGRASKEAAIAPQSN
jgi:cold shock protein